MTKILIVDDHQGVLVEIENLLRHETNFELCKAASLDKAKSHIINCKPDILLIDPYVDGKLCLKSLKGLQDLLPEMAVIVLTAVVDKATQMDLSRLGIHYILEKRVSPDQIIDTLRLVETINQMAEKN